MTSRSSSSSSSSSTAEPEPEQEQEQEQQQQHSCCISHHFFKAASQNLHKIAVIHASPSPPLPGNPASSTRPPLYEGDRCFTFGHVLNSVDSLASVLPAAPPQSAASKFPRIIGIYMPPSVEYIVSVLSVLRCGHAFLPLDPSWPTHRVLSLLHSSTPDLIIASPSPPLGFGCPCPVLPFSMEEAGCRSGDAGGVSVWPCQREPKRSFCYLMYTSGSTGNPKAVCGTELGLLNRFLWMQDSYPLRGEEVLLFKTAISFVDHLQEFLAAMLAACTLVIPPFHKLKDSPFAVIHFLQAYSINRLTAVPSLMRTILPALQHQCGEQIRGSLKLLILSGEVFPIPLWGALLNLLPTTTILNLYGSTEVSGDCTYFDCIRLPMILETKALTSVPIGVPISHCDVVLVSENDMPNEGEIHVGGLCVSEGYFDEATVTSFDFVQVYKNSFLGPSVAADRNQLYYRTGDLAQRLQSGDLVFLGRMDRTVKVNGQRVALEEIETTLKGHPDVVDAAVISREGPEGLLLLDSFLMLKEKDISIDLVRRSIRSWMIGKVPLAMVPNRFLFTASLPVSSSGKVDYALLASSAFLTSHVPDGIDDRSTKGLLEDIKKAFCDALMVEVVSVEDDFFMMGGNSITAAHVAYNLGIDMRVLYKFPTPSKLFTALREKTESCHTTVKTDGGREWKLKADDWSVSHSADSSTSNLQSYQSWKKQLESPDEKNFSSAVLSKRPRVDLNKYICKKRMIPNDKHPWSSSTLKLCSFSRCNKVVYGTSCGLSSTCPLDWSAEVPGNGQGSSMQELWKVLLDSCVDASPLVVFKEQDVYLFIGSHAQKFVCVNAKSGFVHWEVKLEGRIECSAALVANFSQVVVGCYKGKIYFLDFSDGTICWTFQTSGEVKSQPVVDIHRQLIWCGSHDHNLYALDYRRHCCVYKLPCGGSIFGSPAIDEARDMLFVASTSGRVTALSVKALPFKILWKNELEVPVFGSLATTPSGNIICCLVDGSVVTLDLNGSTLWRYKTGGPVFSGACASHVLSSQVLVCSRSGSLYSINMKNGELLWEYNVGDPITASAYVDEHSQLASENSALPSDRLVCVCSSSGNIHLLCISVGISGKANHARRCAVKEFARMKLPGEIFSSPVMIGGRIFVGCRNDYAYCVAFQRQPSLEE